MTGRFQWVVGIVLGFLGIVVPLAYTHSVDVAAKKEEIDKLTIQLKSLAEEEQRLSDKIDALQRQQNMTNYGLSVKRRSAELYQAYFEIDEQQQKNNEWDSKLSNLYASVSDGAPLSPSTFEKAGIDYYKVAPEVVGISSQDIDDQNLPIGEFITSLDVLKDVLTAVVEQGRDIGSKVGQLKIRYYTFGYYEDLSAGRWRTLWPTEIDLQNVRLKISGLEKDLRDIDGRLANYTEDRDRAAAEIDKIRHSIARLQE